MKTIIHVNQHHIKKNNKLSAKDKIKVLLGGYGLDECLGGYDILNPSLKFSLPILYGLG